MEFILVITFHKEDKEGGGQAVEYIRCPSTDQEVEKITPEMKKS